MFKKIAPSFLNKIDEHLLINYPVVWMSRIHYVAWYSLIFYVISALLGWVAPVDLVRFEGSGLWFTMLSIFSFLFLCFWIYKYLIFNKEKTFGNSHWSDAYKNFGLIFVILVIYCCYGIPAAASYDAKVARMYTDEELFSDIITLNETEPFVPTSYTDYESYRDTTTDINYFNVKKHYGAGGTYLPYSFQDSTRFPQFEMLRHGKPYRPTGNMSEVSAKISRFKEVVEKYLGPIDLLVNEKAGQYVSAFTKGWAEESVINNNLYYISYKEDIKNVFSNLMEAKFERLYVWKPEALMAIFYVSFVICLFLMLFKINNWQQFLIMIVVLILYPLITFIFSMVSGSGSDEIFTWFIFLLFIGTGLSILAATLGRDRFSPVFNISNQVFLVMFPFTPMAIVSYLRSKTDVFYEHYYSGYYEDYAGGVNSTYLVKTLTFPDKHTEYIYSWKYYYNEGISAYWNTQYELWFVAMQWLPVFVMILCLPLIHKLFIKQLALPRNS